MEKKLSKLIEDIRTGKIYSSTDVVISSLRVLEGLAKSTNNLSELIDLYHKYLPVLIKARPASAMLANSVRELLTSIVSALERGLSFKELLEELSKKRTEIERRINEAINSAALIASRRIQEGDVILTNSYSRSVLRALKVTKDRGANFSVYVTESRPGSEGLLTASRLSSLGIPVTLFVDSAVRYFMKDVDKVLISCEAVAANGAVVNKIGTSLIALSAHEARVRVFVIGITYKFNPETIFGELIEIAEEEPQATLSYDVKEGIKSLSPLFDVTPPEYIDAIITERGIIAPQAVTTVLREIYGWPFKLEGIEGLLEKLENYSGRRE